MSLTKDQVKHVAKLANLPLVEQDEEKYSKQLSNILEYINLLNSVDTSDVEPTYNVSGKENVLEEDNPKDCLTEDEALSNAFKKQEGFFVTKGVFDNE